MSTVKPREDRPGLALVFGLFAFLCFSLTDTNIKLAVTAGVPVLMAIFFRYWVNFVVYLIYFVPKEGFGVFRSNVPALQAFRGLTLLGATGLNFLSLKYLPLTITIPIFFTLPLFVCLLSGPILGEQVGIRRYVAVLIGFVGVLMITRPGSIAFHPAMLLVLASSFCGALYFVGTRMVAGRDPMPVSQIYAIGLPTACLIPVAYLFWETPEGAFTWGLLIAAGAFAGLGHAVLTEAYRFQEASKVTPLAYSQIVYITIISWVLFEELPDMWTIAGTGLIVAAGLFIWIREQQASK